MVTDKLARTQGTIVNDCPRPTILLRAFEAQLLDDVEDPAIIAHVEECGNCQSRLEALVTDNTGTLTPEEPPDANGNGRLSLHEKTLTFSPCLLSTPGPAVKSLAAETPLPDVPGYEILCRLGSGGMGIVYKARHQKLNRVVALKMILAGEHADADRLARFHVEAEAVARLCHPNIVEIYDIGLANGMPYFALEYLPGGSLKQLFQQGPLLPRLSAELLATLAQAVHTAHLAGIVHRDLNPSNVLRTEDGTAKITDFGVAKRREAPGQTKIGQIIGTPAYMAPEQAKGESESVGPVSDVYALGAILYEALTGQPPFQGKTVMEILRKVQNDEPVPPRQLAAKVPADLETVCLKALRKEPKERYATAQELADELDRFLHDEPVRARPLSRLEKVGRWCCRNPNLGGLLVATTGLMLMATLAIVLMHDQVQLRHALEAKEEADRKQKRYLYVNDICMTDRLYHESQLLRARQLLHDCAADQRGWEWHYLDRITNADLLSLTGHTQPVHALAFAPRQRWLVSGSGDGSLVFWETGSAKRMFELPISSQPVWSLAFSPDGMRLASVAGSRRAWGELVVWDLGTGSDPKPSEVIRIRLADRLGERAAVGYHPSKPVLAVATGVRVGQPGCLLLLDACGKEVRRWSGNADQGCVALAWSPDGRRLAAYFISTQPGATGEVVIFDPDKPEPVCRFEANGGEAAALAFSPDGRLLASGGEDRLIELRDTESFTLRKMCCGHTGAITSLAFASDGRLASGSRDTTVRVWDRQSAQEVSVRRGHYGPVRSVAVQPETGLIFSGSDDITIKAWRAEKPQEAEVFRLHQGAATAIAFGPDGAALISVGMDGAVWRIDPTGGQRPRRIFQERRPLRQVCFLPQSQTILVAGGDEGERGRDGGATRLLDARDGRLSGELDTQLARVSSLSVSRDGRRLAVVGKTKQSNTAVQIWDMTSRPPRYDLVPPELLPGAAVEARPYSGGDKVVVLLAQLDNFLNPSYVLLDLSDGFRLLPGKRYAINGPCFAVFDKEESFVFVGGRDQSFSRFRVSSNGLFRIARYSGHAGAICKAALSPDETLFATASDDETIRLWERQTDRELLVFRGDASAMNDVAFSPTGGFLAAAQASGAVWVWDGRPRPGLGNPSGPAH
jgi:WD40 repeat protein/tRNA A-37 threonylcarbamoyl transferase component Bud32